MLVKVILVNLAVVRKLVSGRVDPDVSILEFSKKKLSKDVAFRMGRLWSSRLKFWLSAGITVDLFLVLKRPFTVCHQGLDEGKLLILSTCLCSKWSLADFSSWTLLFRATLYSSQIWRVRLFFARLYNRSHRLREQRSFEVYQELSRCLFVVILLSVNVRAKFIKLSVHLEAQTSTSISTKQGFQSLFKRASLKPSQSALSYCQINLLYADGLCTLIRGILVDTWQWSLRPSGGWIAMICS